MEIAALILSVLSLILSVFCVSVMVAKEWFSSHVVQMVPVDSVAPQAGGQGRPLTEPFKEIGDPMTEEEMEYFNLNNKGPKK